MSEFDDDVDLSAAEPVPEPDEPQVEAAVEVEQQDTPAVEVEPVKRAKSSKGRGRGLTHQGGDRPDWVLVRRMYVEGERRHDKEFGSYTYWPTLAEVAKAAGYTLGMVSKMAAEQDWTLARADWQATMDERRKDLRARAIAKHTLRMDASAVKAASIGLALVLKRVEQIAEKQAEQDEKINTRLREIAEGRLTAALDDDGFEIGIDGRELETLARAAGAWHTLGRKVLGVEETVKVQFSGGIEVRSSVNTELVRDDPDRLFGFLVAAERSGLLNDNIIEGEVVDDEAYDTIEPGTEFIPPRPT